MYLVKWENILTGRSGQKKAETEAEANEWLQRKINKQHFGKNARQAVRDQDLFDESLVLSEFEDTNEFGESRTIVSLKAEYTYEGPTLIDGSGVTEEDKQERKRVALEKVALFRKLKNFGEEVELYFTALINERNYTSEQKDSLQVNTDVGAILAELKFGRIGKAKSMIDAMVADEDLFFEADLEAVSKHMEDFLSEL